MKTLLSAIVFLMIAFCVQAQIPATGVVKNQKDFWGNTYSYSGELKNGVPNGMGVAYYSDGNFSRYVGGFVNGKFSGKGVIFFTDSTFLYGEFRDGNINGKGANLTSDGALYIGDFAKGVKSGQGVLFYKDNGFLKGGFANDKIEGRAVYLWSNAKVLSDCIYANDKQNGTGYQYELSSKTLFKGEWKDGNWVQSTTPDFSSFLESPSFIGEATDDHILMGSVMDNGHLKDTSFYYSLTKHKRYFGYYEDGFIKNGIQIKDDSTRFIGPVNDEGANGYCYDFKFGSYYSEGNYTNDYLNGDIIDIDLAKRTVYMGKSVMGEYTGKAYFFNGSGTMYRGDYVKGQFTGQGYRVETTGRTIAGTWDDGSAKIVTSLVTGKGETINTKPKTLGEAMNIVTKEFYDYYDNISGYITYDDEDWLDFLYDSYDDDYSDFYTSYLSFPGSVKPDLTRTNFDSTNLYVTTLFESTDAEKARAKYVELGKQLQALTISNSHLAKPAKLQGTVAAPDMRKSENKTVFDLTATEAEYSRFHVWLKVRKDSTDTYIVTVEIGENQNEDE